MKNMRARGIFASMTSLTKMSLKATVWANMKQAMKASIPAMSSRGCNVDRPNYCVVSKV